MLLFFFYIYILDLIISRYPPVAGRICYNQRNSKEDDDDGVQL